MTIYNGVLILGGDFSNTGGVSSYYIAQWIGTSWYPLDSTEGPVYALTEMEGYLVAGLNTSPYVQTWDGSSWSTLAGGTSGPVYALQVYKDTLIVGGALSRAGSIQANYIAALSIGNFTWKPLSFGMDRTVRTLTVYQNLLIAGGEFTLAGGTFATGVAKWNGLVWSALGAGTNYYVLALNTLDMTVPTVVPTTPIPTTEQPTTPPADCSLAANDWRAQYYVNNSVLVEDYLTFDGSRAFTQKISSFPFQPCPANYIFWMGRYSLENPTSLTLSYADCDQQSAGCLRCGTTYEDRTTISFNAACEILRIRSVVGGMERIYYSTTAWARQWQGRV